MIKRTVRLLIVVLVVVAMQACAVQRTVRVPPSTAMSRLSVGDDIIVALKSGRKYKAVVMKMTDAELVTRNSRYPWKDISYISRSEYDPSASFFSTIGTYYLVSAIAALVFIYALEHSDSQQ